jgi:chorismate lyase / 3-hydroxybenzoate synthase
MGSDAPLQVTYLPRHELAERPARWWHGVLGLVSFGGASAADEIAQIPLAEVRAPVLSTNGSVCEVWHTPGTARSGTRSRIRYRHTADLLFGSIELQEADFPPAGGAATATALQHATELAYGEIFALLDALGHRHLLRVWNYLPRINVETAGSERYRQFNAARQNAFIASGRPVTGNVPAACALGSPNGSPLVIYFLAGREPPIVVENPRQVSAYHYPPAYGARSPTFSRASLSHPGAAGMLFVAGTASIVGHETVHVGDAAAQTLETLANIAALVEDANRAAGATRFRLERLQYKVYIRHPEDFPKVDAQIRTVLAPSVQVVYLQAQICRSDLLVEIEATAGPASQVNG